MGQKNVYEKEVDIKQCIQMLIHKAIKIILVGILMAVIITGYKYITSGSAMGEDTQITYQPTTDYLGSASIFLGSESTAITSTTARTYLTGYEMLEGAIDKLNLNLTYEQLKSMINLNNSTDSMIIVNVTGAEEKLVQDIIDYLATIGSDNLIIKLTNPEVTLLEPAFTIYREYNVEIPKTVHSIPKLMKELIKSAIIGFVFGIFLAAVIYLIILMIDDTIKDEKDAYSYLEVPILGSVSIIKSTEQQVEMGKRKKQLRLTQYSEQL